MDYNNRNFNTLMGYLWLATTVIIWLIGFPTFLWSVGLICAVINFVAQDILNEIRRQAGAQRVLTSRLDNSL